MQLSEAKSAVILGIGSIVNFFATVEPALLNAWLGVACGLLALFVTLPKAINSLLVLRKSVRDLVSTILKDVRKHKHERKK